MNIEHLKIQNRNLKKAIEAVDRIKDDLLLREHSISKENEILKRRVDKLTDILTGETVIRAIKK